MMRGVDVRLKALDVLDAAMAGQPDPGALFDQLRPDLEVLARDDLVRVLVDVAATASVVTGRASRPTVLERLSKLRVQAMWQGSSGEE